jgi:hypothetical protein
MYAHRQADDAVSQAIVIGNVHVLALGVAPTG